jgi:uncharacterized protein (TIGR00369 family)
VAQARTPWEDLEPSRPHVWRTLEYRRVSSASGATTIEWDASPDYSFPASSGYIVHGGLVATLLDTAMGGACFSILEEGETFLTADLNVEFFRPARPGVLRADGRVVHRATRMVFCAAELRDPAGEQLAGARCTQVLRPDR